MEGRRKKGRYIYLSDTVADTLDGVAGCFTDVADCLSDGVCYATDGVLETACETCREDG